MPGYQNLDARRRMRFAVLFASSLDRQISRVKTAVTGLIGIGLGTFAIFYLSSFFPFFIPIGIFICTLSVIMLNHFFIDILTSSMFNKFSLAMGNIMGIPFCALAGFYIASVIFPLPAIGIISGAIIGTLVGISAGVIVGPLISYTISHILDALDMTDPGGVCEAYMATTGAILSHGMLLGGIAGFLLTPIGPIIGMMLGGILLTSIYSLWRGINGIYNNAYDLTLNPPNSSMFHLHSSICTIIEALMPEIKEKPNLYPGSSRIGEIVEDTSERGKYILKLSTVKGVQYQSLQSQSNIILSF